MEIRYMYLYHTLMIVEEVVGETSMSFCPK
jgi:hypothetical protein